MYSTVSEQLKSYRLIGLTSPLPRFVFAGGTLEVKSFTGLFRCFLQHQEIFSMGSKASYVVL